MIVQKTTSQQQVTYGNPLFVIGLWRSGTSLLYALLNQHPGIKLLYESDVPLLWPLFLRPGHASWAQRLDFWNAVVRRHQLDASVLPRDADLPTAFELLARQYADARGAAIWGCKSPNYYALAPRLARYFPHARFIFVWRDPAEICASIRRAAGNSFWFRRRGMPRRVVLGCETLKRDCERLKSAGAPVHELYYRDLVDNPALEMRAICEFLRIEFDPAMASPAGADLSAVYNGDHHELLRNASGVRSSSGGERQDGCPPALKRKIERYKVLWRGRFPTWRIAAVPQASNPPGLSERVMDRLLFRSLWALDYSRRWIFALLPMRCWRMYRCLMYTDADRFIESPAMRDPLPSGKGRSAGVTVQL